MINKDDLKPLAEKESEGTMVVLLSMAFLACSIFVIAQSVMSMAKVLSDNSIPLVHCPKSYSLDSPVLLAPVKEGEPLQKDAWIRGFMRKYVLSQFPRTGGDVKPFFEYIAAHSEGRLSSRFDSLASGDREIAALIDNNYYTKFYPKSSDDLRIRATDHESEWVVEIDGYLVKRIGLEESRTTPTLRYTVVARASTLSNPEGLFVTESNIDKIVDYQSGRKK